MRPGLPVSGAYDVWQTRNCFPLRAKAALDRAWLSRERSFACAPAVCLETFSCK